MIDPHTAFGLFLIAASAAGGSFFVAWLHAMRFAPAKDAQPHGDLDYSDGWRDGVSFAKQSIFEEGGDYVAGYSAGHRAGVKRERKRGIDKGIV